MRQKITVAMSVLGLLVCASMLSGCYTTQGAGKDIQAAGQGISHSAAEHTSYRP